MIEMTVMIVNCDPTAWMDTFVSVFSWLARSEVEMSPSSAMMTMSAWRRDDGLVDKDAGGWNVAGV